MSNDDYYLILVERYECFYDINTALLVLMVVDNVVIFLNLQTSEILFKVKILLTTYLKLHL